MYTTEQYTALCSAIALGVTKVAYADKTVEYRSLAEMKQLKADMELSLGMRTQSKIIRTQFDRGYER